MKKAALYGRTSTRVDDLEPQFIELRDIAAQGGYDGSARRGNGLRLYRLIRIATLKAFHDKGIFTWVPGRTTDACRIGGCVHLTDAQSS